jgi:putative addiction module component (TIGR02574 family)
MSTYADVLRVALSLSAKERGELADAILDSLDEEVAGAHDPPHWSDAWRAEIARRSAEIDATTVQSFNWAETKLRAREKAPRDRYIRVGDRS